MSHKRLSDLKNAPAAPLDAKKGPREELIYVNCVLTGTGIRGQEPDYLATVDVNPESPTYCKVLHRLPMPNINDELFCSGWNACSSCFGDTAKKRNRLILPCFGSSRIYVVDTGTDPKNPSLYKVIEPGEVFRCNLSFLHTPRCLENGDIMISAAGDQYGNGKGGFLLLDGETFEVKGTWERPSQGASLGYDFCYQPKHNVLVSTELGAPNYFVNGLNQADLGKDRYGRALNVWDWTHRTVLQSIDLGADSAPSEVRFLNEPYSDHGMVACALQGSVHHFFKAEDGSWAVKKVIQIPTLSVSGWILPEMPAMITSIAVSSDNRFLYLNNFTQGDVRQYDITDLDSPRQVGQVFLGGSVVNGGPVTVHNKEYTQPDPCVIQGRRIFGGPATLRLSSDDKRLYVTNGLYTPWDKQIYPELVREGSVMMQIDVDTEKGGLTVNGDFLVDFGNEPSGPARAHDMRYPCPLDNLA